jgi:O-antigen ligase
MRRLAFWLTVAIVFTLPWENVAGVPGVGSISRAVGLAAAAVWGLAVIGTGSVRRPTGSLLLALAFVAWNGLSVVWSIEPGVSVGRFVTFAQLFVMMYLLWDTMRTARDVRIVMQAYVIGVWITVMALIEHALLDGPAGYQVRFTLGNFQFDDIGVVFALGIPLAWYLATTPTRTRPGQVLRIVNVAAVPLAIAGIMFSGTRAAMVMVAPSLVYVLVSVTRLRPRDRALSLAGICLLLVALLPLVPTSTIDRILSTATDRSQGDFNGRTELWAGAWSAFKDHPLVGVGTGAYREETSGKVTHDVWLRLSAELGLVGISLFLLLLVVLVVGATRERGPLRQFSVAVLAVWMIGATVYNLEDKKLTWLVLSLVLAAPVVRERQGSPPPLPVQAALPRSLSADPLSGPRR